jgi:hypothetical protein
MAFPSFKEGPLGSQKLLLAQFRPLPRGEIGHGHAGIQLGKQLVSPQIVGSMAQALALERSKRRLGLGSRAWSLKREPAPRPGPIAAVGG